MLTNDFPMQVSKLQLNCRDAFQQGSQLSDRGLDRLLLTQTRTDSTAPIANLGPPVIPTCRSRHAAPVSVKVTGTFSAIQLL